ncbi:MAG: hypothetical protein HC927_04690, partial [Deltaproteobacteria bacterium]|nr:hypothetical protein [Deltaproteobacteria bacterium]
MSVVVRDLLSGAEHASFAGAEYPHFDFAPMYAGPGIARARLWSCTQGLLRVHSASDASVLSEQVRCFDIVASQGSPRIVFPTHTPELGLADLEQGSVVLANPTPMDQPGEVFVPRIDHEGRRLVVRGGLDLGESPLEYEYDLRWSVLLDDQLALVTELDVGLFVAGQGREPGAPLWLKDDGSIYRLSEARGLELIDDEIPWAGSGRNIAKQSGHIFYARAGDPAAIMRLGPELDAEPEHLFDTDPGLALIASAQGRALALVRPFGTTSYRIRVWREDAGLIELAPEWFWHPSVLFVRDDGGLMLLSPLPGSEELEFYYSWIDREGRLLARMPGFPVDGSPSVTQLHDGRVLILSNHDGASPLALVYPNTEGIRWLFDRGDVADFAVSADGRRLAALLRAGEQEFERVQPSVGEGPVPQLELGLARHRIDTRPHPHDTGDQHERASPSGDHRHRQRRRGLGSARVGRLSIHFG